MGSALKVSYILLLLPFSLTIIILILGTTNYARSYYYPVTSYFEPYVELDICAKENSVKNYPISRGLNMFIHVYLRNSRNIIPVGT